MKLLIIGGTRFVGRHLVVAALAAGHQVTLFNRGRSAPAPDGVTQRLGDRRGDLSALGGGRWDAVIDTCGYLPAEVARMAAHLQGRVDRYVFVSSVSVYAGAATPNDEDSPLGVIDDTDTEVVDGRTYGPLKALCEAEVTRRFGEAALVLRPGLIVGPFDPTQRFTYWPARVARAARGETVLAPGVPQAPLQWIDARDLAAFALRALADETSGTFNLAGEPGQSTMGRLLQTCAEVAGTQPVLRWADVARLQALGLQPWSDLPLALPDDDEHRGFMHTDVRRALAAGLRNRPAAQTVADTLAWHRSLPLAQQVLDKAGLSATREAAVLSALDATGGA